MPKNVGVVVARFQVHRLTEGHLALLDHALEANSRVILFLGNSPLKNSTANPLDFRTRKHMVEKAYPGPGADLTIKYINDTGDNASWARALDKLIADETEEGDEITLYGSRDSFIPHYLEGGGEHRTEIIQTVEVRSGTETRKEIARTHAITNEAGRAAMIYASQDRFPTSYQCVDVAVLNRDAAFLLNPKRSSYGTVELQGRIPRILLARKKTDKLLRFFGGFVDPTDASLEAAARREVAEEANGIEIDGIKYVGSARVEDWRYAREPDGIMTALFVAQYQYGNPKPTDDLEGGEVRWVALDDLKITDIVPQHRHLFELLLQKGI